MVFVGAISPDGYPAAESGRSVGVTTSNGEFLRENIFILEVVMRDVRRIRMHCILLVFLIVISALAGCSDKQPANENGNIKMNESAVHDFSKGKDEALTEIAPDKSAESFMSEYAATSLTALRREMDGTTYLFAAAYLGYIGEATENPAEWIQDICPQIMVDYPFIKEISEKQIVGNIGDLYCIVPRDAQASVMIRQMIDEEDTADGAKKAGDVLYRSETGMPILLFCNEFRYRDRADVEISVEGTDGKQAVWQPMLDKAEYIVLPQNDAGEFLAMDFTYYPNGNAGFGDTTPMGWYAPDLEDLRETVWSTYQDPDEGERTIYYLDLYGGEQADYGEYDGEACFAWRYGDEECQEYYEGWWSLEEVEGQVCLCLDICRIGGLMYREGEEPKVISNQFPVLCDSEGLSMILHKGLQNGESLPFLNEQTDFEFLTQPVE